ncbi:ATP-binding cassette domain-containing protein [Kribbella shirazensis]|uniref:ABC-type sugar transport system ATPase subunit n=1 Tax=Kribbella shirazensis TaxID=1105143 RepID=A0A7X6A5P5_9ACTN|nr:sugar ABC transporter ATP-binding protein [Kribbella shirazensis]NIK61504.1 ABC-type sugar transport system ATPase subunit [Kribbella shirazensis]
MRHTNDPAVSARGVTMRYGATVALDDIDVTIRRGAVTAVVGANGSGKTTLLRVVCGAIDATRGTITGPDGVPVTGLAAAQRAGIVLVPQEPTVAGHLPVWQNVVLGRPEARRGPFLADRAGREYAARHLAGLLPESVMNVPTATLSKSARQLVQLAAAMARHPRVLMLDEPTAVLDEDGVENLHALIRRSVGAGGTVVIVSHRLRDVLELADEVVVLRNGRVSHTGPVGPGTEQHVVRLLSAGERPDQARHRPDLGHVVLEARGLRGWRGLTVDHLVAHRGEIVGVAGQSGSGRSRLASVLAGAWPAAAGKVTVEGRPVRLGDIRSAQAAGVAYIPEDRQQTGILGNLPVSANLLVGRDDGDVRRGPFRRRAGERAASSALIERFEVRPADPDRPAALLSGGNQQKLVVGRALARPARLVLADEPTQGVDASARAAIHAALAAAAAAGSAVVAMCSEFDELFEISDRVVVLRDGRLVLDRPVGDVTQDEVLAASLGSDVEEAHS